MRQLLSAGAAGQKPWLPIPTDWQWAGSPARVSRQVFFFFFVRGRGGRLNALNAQCTGCELPRWLCQKDPSAVDLSEGDTLPPGSAECGGGDGGSAGRTPGGAGGQ